MGKKSVPSRGLIWVYSSLIAMELGVFYQLIDFLVENDWNWSLRPNSVLGHLGITAGWLLAITTIIITTMLIMVVLWIRERTKQASSR